MVGLPGDKIGFHGDTLYINDKPMHYTVKGEYIGKGKGAEMTGTTLLVEDLPGRTHTVLEWLDRNMPAGQGDWTVPADSYFVMGIIATTARTAGSGPKRTFCRKPICAARRS